MRPKLLVFLVIAIALQGCTTVDKDKERRVELNGGAITISYGKNGEFISLESKAIARVTSSLPGARDEAATVATLRARRQIVEFLKSDLDSEQQIKTQSNSAQKSNESQAGINSRSIDADISYSVRETLRQRSAGVIQGSFIVSERFDQMSNTVIVVVAIGKAERSTLVDLRNYFQ